MYLRNLCLEWLQARRQVEPAATGSRLGGIFERAMRFTGKGTAVMFFFALLFSFICFISCFWPFVPMVQGLLFALMIVCHLLLMVFNNFDNRRFLKQLGDEQRIRAYRAQANMASILAERGIDEEVLLEEVKGQIAIKLKRRGSVTDRAFQVMVPVILGSVISISVDSPIALSVLLLCSVLAIPVVTLSGLVWDFVDMAQSEAAPMRDLEIIKSDLALLRLEGRLGANCSQAVDFRLTS